MPREGDTHEYISSFFFKNPYSEEEEEEDALNGKEKERIEGNRILTSW